MTIRRTLIVLSSAIMLGSCTVVEDPTPEAPVEVGTTVADLGYEAREGRALFEHYCTTCHGDEGRGDGFNAYNLDPKPRDLSEPAFQQSRSDEELAELIRLGGAAAGLSNAMPPWGRTLNDRGVDYLVAYLRVLRPEVDEAESEGR